VPLRSAAANLYFAGDSRDLPLNLSQIVLASAIEVADAIRGDAGGPSGGGGRRDVSSAHVQDRA